MEALKNTLNLLNENWSNIVIIIGLLTGLYAKVNSYLKKNKEERVEAAKKAVKENILKYISDAQIQWREFEDSGAIKRSQVISKVYADYPILKEYLNQEELIKYIDELIADGLKTVRDTVDPMLESTAKSLD